MPGSQPNRDVFRLQPGEYRADSKRRKAQERSQAHQPFQEHFRRPDRQDNADDKQHTGK